MLKKEIIGMREPKDEDRVRSPMFPRLHVNDTEKGGPRAPPRNKMALYEQLSIPSQRLGSGSVLMMPLPNETSMASSMSSSHAGGFERSMFTPFCNSPAPSQSETSFTPHSGGVALNTKMSSPEQKSVNSRDDQSLNSTQPLSSSAKCNSVQSHNSNLRNFLLKKPGDADNIRPHSSAQSGAVLHYSSNCQSKDRENQPYWNMSFSVQFKNISENQKSKIGIIDVRERETLSNQTEESRKISDSCQNPAEKSFSLLSNKTLVDASCSPSGKVICTKSLKRVHPSSDQEYGRNKVDSLKRMHGMNGRSDQNFVAKEEKTVHKDKSLLENAGGIGKENASKVTNESCSKLSLHVDKRSHNVIESGGKSDKDRNRGSLQVVDVKRHNLSETFEVDSLSAQNITPDDVVRIIGEKQFWKARKAIVDQQRTFGVQVFELHRLLKVQKLIATSPNLLLKDGIYLRKALLKSSPVRKVPSEHAIQQPPPIAKSKDGSQKPCPIAESPDEHAVEKLPLPSVHVETDKGVAHESNRESHSHSGAAGPAPNATDTRAPPWCVPGPGNQWLVPVMSPSEGLVYKPYTAPCHPHTGYIAPVYANCPPPAGSGDFLNAVYGVPASHQQGIGIVPSAPPFGQTYFPQCVMPIMPSSVSGSAVEQNSCNMSSQMSRTISYRVGKVEASKENEIQGSTASSLPPRPNGHALPLFPTEPTSQASDQNAQSNEQQTHVIKVVPHNRRLATESAARIFQSIQEERKQCY
ncbi:ELF3-like protein 2 isoform X2 [Euphorbia lathyris]|uniref:ELF3-like protein 2 isoform X2 n=1 Tax=Euphorbia lathyris TaxID=212925 RepID=UPI0033131A58